MLFKNCDICDLFDSRGELIQEFVEPGIVKRYEGLI